MKYLAIQSLAVLCLTGVAAITTPPAAAATPGSSGEPGIRIDTHRMGLTQRDTVTRLYARIQSSARKVCRDSSSSSDNQALSTFQHCYTAAVDDAVQSLHSPLLTALHEEAARTRIARRVD